MKIAITGGHPAPALAVIEEALSDSAFKNVEFVFIGRRYNNEREQTDSYEYKEATRLGIPFHNLKTGRLTRLVSFRTFKSMALIPKGFIDAYALLRKLKPDRILSFGGYIALPVAYAAKLLGIPVITHEQTIHPGLANRFIGSVARDILISFPQSKAYFEGRSTIQTGNPVRGNVLKPAKLPFTIPSGLPVIYVTGGSLGSHSVNRHIEKLLPRLLNNYVVIHQTGNVEEFDDFPRLKAMRERLPENIRERYIVVQHVSGEDIGGVYAKADMVIARSGANTVFELIMLKKPSILIPLPWSAHNEQQAQARLMADAHVAEVFEQSEPSEKLAKTVEMVMNDLPGYREGFSSLSVMNPKGAARHVLETVLND